MSTAPLEAVPNIDLVNGESADVAEGVRAWMRGAVVTTTEAATTVVQHVKRGWSWFWGKVKSAATWVWHKAQNAAHWVKKKASSAWSWMKEHVPPATRTAWTNVKNAGATAWNWATWPVKMCFGTVAGVATSLAFGHPVIAGVTLVWVLGLLVFGKLDILEPTAHKPNGNGNGGDGAPLLRVVTPDQKVQLDVKLREMNTELQRTDLDKKQKSQVAGKIYALDEMRKGSKGTTNSLFDAWKARENSALNAKDFKATYDQGQVRIGIQQGVNEALHILEPNLVEGAPLTEEPPTPTQPTTTRTVAPAAARA